MYDHAWNNEDPVTELGIDVPRWIESDIDPATVAAIVDGGCASGAYMPAVTYHDALRTMTEYGDHVLDYLEEQCGDLPTTPAGESWAGMAVYYLSTAVELWAYAVIDEIEDKLTPEDES